MRLDAPRLLAQLKARHGINLTYAGPAAGGEVGAAFVTWPDGHHGVLTRSSGTLAAAQRIAGLLDVARAAGIPAPRHELVVELPDAVVIVQERLPGSPARTVDRALVERMITVAQRGAGLLADRPDVPQMPLYLRESGPGFCLHAPLERYDTRTRALLRTVRAIDAPELHGTDLVHADFHAGNVLVDAAGELTGVVDWTDAARGDHRFAIVTLLFDLVARGGTDAVRYVEAWLDTHLDPEELRAYWAHMSLRLVDWSIRHHGASEVDRWLRLAARRL